MGSASVLRAAALAPTRRSLGSQGTAPAPSSDSARSVAPVAVSSEMRATLDAAKAAAHAEGLRQGMAEAEQRIRDAMTARERILREKYDRAEAKLTEQVAHRLGVIDGVAKSLRQAQDAQWPELEDAAVRLALTALARVLGSESGREQVLAALVGEGLTKVRSTPRRVRMNPADLQLLLEGSEGQSLQARHVDIHWLGDPSLELGQCQIDIDRGSIEIGIDSQLARISAVWSGQGDTA